MIDKPVIRLQLYFFGGNATTTTEGHRVIELDNKTTEEALRSSHQQQVGYLS